MFNRLIGNTLLFTDRLMNKKAVFKPNQSAKEQSNLPGPSGMDENQNKKKKDKIVMDADILQNAKLLVIKKQQKDDIEDIKLSMKKMQKTQNLISQQINHIIEKLNG